ncbi:RecQ family ATP-dependent DNA helicase [Phytoactinopolyspora halotolerans]|uniref:DNA 3'-5' helicase n=1 Tax=Phytoactinopolyspora halotolerans TaxID=1981512 RepID=A0A6L9SEC0_9ACTN|nr:RecQ family ATP-dependent DNA helicase [Phytoactinopolyspora halotolerans]NEE02841.1 ATP-dependent DNA helicase RecQ [Phytoactinopolyspora halotolerans]
MELKDEAEALLRRLVGDEAAAFRDGQWDAVRDLVEHRRRVLVVQRTGWGKSAVYFVATGLLRARGLGATVIVSPLLALMRDQVAAAERAGIRAVTINSANAEKWGEIAQALADDAVDVLLVSPERLNNPRFREEQLPTLAANAGLIVVDEAHCVSDWGHDFRPDYRRIRDLLDSLPADTPVLATTATANARVVADVAEQLGSGGADVRTQRGSLARDSLRLGVLRLKSSEERLGWLAAHLGELPGSGIIYALTVSGAEDTAELLRDAGYDVRAYTGRTDPADRVDAEQALLHNKVKALIATSALGMGFDKPDLGFVIHLGAPSSPVAYYQQVGRAGRATERADVLLLPAAEDIDIWHYFATVSMPKPDQAEAVIAALSQAGQPMSTAALETVADVRRTRLELLLKVLDVEGAVRRVRGGWEATGQPWVYDAERYARVAQTRTAEADLMRAYQRGEQCRMAFLQQVLDDSTAEPCGRCDVCAGPWYDATVPEQARSSARSMLGRAGVPLEPRVQWPSGMARLGIDVRGKISHGERVEPGRAIARLTDLGWGQRLRDLFTGDDAPATDAVLAACVEVLREWPWEHRPQAVAWVPSSRRPQLIRSVAEHLASVGRLPDLGSLEFAADAPPAGEPGGNSAFRLATVWERWRVGDAMRDSLAGLGPEPVVLLVDDLADSRWTATVAGRALRLAGAGQVLPFALAVAA